MQTKYLFVICFSLFTLGVIQAQDISISFSVDGNESLDSVYVYNKTKKIGVPVPIGSVLILGKNVGVDDVESGKNGLSIIPNPIIDDALLCFPLSTSGNTKIQAFSLDGTLLGGMNSELEAGINTIRMKLPKGACLIKVSSKGGNYTSKAISTNSSVHEPSFILESNIGSHMLAPRKAPTNAVALNYENGDSILYYGYSSVYFSSVIGYDFPTTSKDIKFNFTPQTDSDVEAYLNLVNSNFVIGFGLINKDEPRSTWNMWSVYGSMNGWSQISSATTDEMFDSWYSTRFFGWGSNESQFLYRGLYQRTKVVAQITGYLYSLQNQLVWLQNKPFKTAVDVTSIAVRKKAIAEFHSLRGWLMFLLNDWFGAVDVQLDPAKLSLKNYSYRPANDANYTQKYLNAMVSDFKQALPDLEPTTHHNSPYWGHVNKNMTRMLLMKHYMNRASATGKTEYWDSAKVYCDEVINEGVYSLNPVYSKVFSDIDSTGATNGNNEVIWAATYYYNPKNSSSANIWGNAYQFGYHFKTNLPQKCDSISGIATDPSNWNGYTMPWSFFCNYDQTGVATGTPKDARLFTIAERYHDSSYGWVTKDSPSDLLYYGAIAVKWLISKERSSKGQYCMPAFRYADVLLSAAEIENELNGPTAKAKQYLKLVTDRSGTTDGKNFLNVETGDSVMGASMALATTNKQVFRDFLFAERGRELYWEGWRRMDMIRFKNANGVSRYLEYASKIRPTISTSDTKWLLFPLPIQATMPAGGLYEDNPGY
jgi:hypothetical protein